jgi:integrase
MSLYLQGTTWWCEISVGGKLYRSSTRTADKTIAQKIEDEHRDSLTLTGQRVSATLHDLKAAEAVRRAGEPWEGIEAHVEKSAPVQHGPTKAEMRPPQAPPENGTGVAFEAMPINYGQIRPEMTFVEAAAAFDEWMSSPVSARQARYKSYNTMKDIRTKLKALTKYFGPQKLQKIAPGELRKFQELRSSNIRGIWAHPAGATKVNAELGLLLRIMKLGNAYSSEIQKWHQPLKVEEREIERALSPEQQERFLQIAASRPEWAIVHWYALLALHIAWSSDEIRTLRQGDINLEYHIIAVNRKHGKNYYRRRETPITDSAALWALQQLFERSTQLAGQSPQNHLFPARISRGNFDGSRHMGATGIRKQFDAVRKAADLPWFKQNGFRHTSITRMAEAGVHIATMMARAGHCEPKMTDHYTHISMQAERQAMQRLGSRSRVIPPAGAPTRAKVNLADPSIQKEIASQALALAQQMLAQQQSASPSPAPPASPTVSRLIKFPGDQAVRQ